MSAVAEHLPLPVGARFAAPARRSRVDTWAAPNPTQLVLDPWAAPVGLAVARTRVSPWSAPSAATRITWMPSPAALLPPPVAFQRVDQPEAAIATERAIATVRAFVESPRKSALLVPTALVAPIVADAPISTVGATEPGLDTLSLVEPMPAGHEFASEPTVQLAPPRVAPPQVGTAIGDRTSKARWRLAAIVTGVGAATAAVVTLLASVL